MRPLGGSLGENIRALLIDDLAAAKGSAFQNLRTVAGYPRKTSPRRTISQTGF